MTPRIKIKGHKWKKLIDSNTHSVESYNWECRRCHTCVRVVGDKRPPGKIDDIDCDEKTVRNIMDE